MINKEDPKLKAGDFGLMDLNIGYFLPAIEAGWEIVGLPVFSKRKPAFQLIFCHADSAIRPPKDLGRQTHRLAHLPHRTDRLGARTVATNAMAWTSPKVQWVLQAKEVFPVHDNSVEIDYVDESKNMSQRLIAGELDAIITDISDTKMFENLENQSKDQASFSRLCP